MLSKAQGVSLDGDEASRSPGGAGDGAATVGSRPVLPQKIKSRIVPPRGLYPKELEAGSPTDPWAPAFTAALSVTAKMWEPLASTNG